MQQELIEAEDDVEDNAVMRRRKTWVAPTRDVRFNRRVSIHVP